MNFARDASGACIEYPLSRRAAAFMAELPSSMKLRVLRRDHPEVLDLIAACWNDPLALARTFDRLQFAGESCAPTLSLAALLEVALLQQHHAATRLPRAQPSVWDLAFDTVR